VYKVFDNATYVPTGEPVVIAEIYFDNPKSSPYRVLFKDANEMWTTADNLAPVAPKGPAATAGEALVKGERQNDYGDPDVSFNRIAKLWSAHLGVNVTKRDVALMMILMKVSREKSAHKEDNLADIEGYVYCARILKEGD
jgi:hypothetical protein